MFGLWLLFVLGLVLWHIEDVRKGRTLNSSAIHERIRILMQHKAGRERYTQAQWPIMVSHCNGYTEAQWQNIERRAAR